MWTETLELDVEELLSKGKRLDAIKLIMQGMDLKYLNEARQVLNNFEERMEIQTPHLSLMPPLPDDLEEEVRELLPTNKIQAIRAVRCKTLWELKDAKDAVEDIQYNRVPWPEDLNWFIWCDVRKMVSVPVPKGIIGVGRNTEAMKLIQNELGVEEETAFQICDAIRDGRIKEPKRPPKLRSIDDD